MENLVSTQFLEFLYATVFGLSLGVLYDIIALLRGAFSGKIVLKAILDVLYCMLSAVAFFAFMLLTTDGRIRWYVILAIFIGFFLYKNAISGLFFYLSRSIIKTCGKVFDFICTPVRAMKRRVRERGTKEKTEKET